MKCPKCSAEWHLPKQSTSIIKSCPFCGASLQIDADQSLTTLDSVLAEIIARFGIDILRDGSRTVAVFSDLAPKLKKERLLLTYLMQFDGNVKLLEVQKLDKSKQHATYLRVVQHLVDEQFVAQQAAENVCLGFLKAIGIVIEVPTPVQEVVKSTPVQPEKAPTPTPPAKPQQTTYRTPPKPTPPATTKTRTPKVSSYSEYMKLLEEYFLQNGKVQLTREQVQSFIYTYALNVDWKITYSEVEKDLATIYSKYSVARPAPKPITPKPPASSPPQRKSISTYNDYMKALEQRFNENNQQMLSRAQIVAFLDEYNLSKRFNIQIHEVETDLREIQKKSTFTHSDYLSLLEQLYVNNGRNRFKTLTQIPEFMRTYDLENRLGVTPAKIKEDLMTIAQQSPKPSAPSSPQRKNILTYNDYLEALEQRFIENNKRMLSRAQIVSFLDEYNLSKTFNVQIHEVETDLREIQKKCITTRSDYLSILEQRYIDNGRNTLKTLAQLHEFMKTYDLENRLGLTLSQIREDLMKIVRQS